jgi:predicted RND superfamily exporter protein
MALKEKINVERALERLATFQCRHYKKIIVVALILTVVLGYGMTTLRFQGDFSKEMPQDLPPIALEDRISSIFGGGETLVVVVDLNEDTGARDIPSDIRDPKIIASVVELHNRLEAEPLIEGVQSVAPVFQDGVPDDVEGVKRVLASVPGAENYFNRDFRITVIYAFTSAGLDAEKLEEIELLIQNDVDAITKPAGVDYKITGEAPLIVEVVRLLQRDMTFTSLMAALIIFGLLVVLERAFTKGFLVFLPLIFAIVWTYGTMGFLSIPISVSTVVIGAVILGLGVEYGIFMVSRYYEERREQNKDRSAALITAVSTIGGSTFGSAATTIAAFLALTLSIMPLIQNLGKTLALGITLCWIAAVAVNPCFIMFEEEWREGGSGKCEIR